MRRSSRPRSLAILAAAIAALAWCAGAALMTGQDPMAVAELAVLVIVAAWAALTLREIRTGHALGRALRAASGEAAVAGLPCRLIEAGPRDAFVVGALSPTIYVGSGYVESLDEDELRAVMLHEEHHRRTRAPLRAAALESWRRLARPSRSLHGFVTARLAELEVAADAFAMDRGADPGALASALLKSERASSPAAAFSGAADLRIAALVGAARGETPRATRLPIEWLPLPVIGAALVACHLGIVLGVG